MVQRAERLPVQSEREYIFGDNNLLAACIHGLLCFHSGEVASYKTVCVAGNDYFSTSSTVYLRKIIIFQRLSKQLNPFSPALRPIVSHNSDCAMSNDNNPQLFEFCKSLIETYLAVLIHMESQRVKYDSIVNALSNFRINYEDNQASI